ncbi:HI1506-related protein [Pseudomonas aeruginosa]|uniref:HI1506-related protein n=2 Tax=Pseudomonas aeruginosa TaxID=287 RepID=UPI001F5B1496|nr:HI1506-related protein [Pseudomonas aeruginosa]UIO45611.1 HI1506-related protein [Pseudomonas aeruginosa]
MARKAATTAKPTARLARQAAGDEAQQSVEGIFVRSYPPTFRRAGFAFTSEGIGIALSALTEAQLKAIKEEPQLRVESCEFLPDDIGGEVSRPRRTTTPRNNPPQQRTALATDGHLFTGVRHERPHLAISQLTIAAQNAEHNAPIIEAQGDLAQAELDRRVAAECHSAIDVLEHQEQQQ